MTILRDPERSDEPYGVRCPVCQGKASKVLEAREGRGYVRRRHLCLSAECLSAEHEVRDRIVKGVRWTTYEFFSPRRGAITVPRGTRAIRSVLASNWSGSPAY